MFPVVWYVLYFSFVLQADIITKLMNKYFKHLELVKFVGHMFTVLTSKI